MYCMQSKLKTCPKSEGSITAGGCSFNSFLRRTVRFVGASNHDTFFNEFKMIVDATKMQTQSNKIFVCVTDCNMLMNHWMSFKVWLVYYPN